MGKKISNSALNRPTLDEYKSHKKFPIKLVLDNVRSMQNVGSAFRTADAFGIEEIILCGITAQPPHRDIQKAALGATKSVKWSYSKTTVETVNNLINNNYRVFSIEQVENAIILNNFTIRNNEKVAFVFGHEVNGVSQQVVDLCEQSIEIPQIGTKHSLNISVSIGMVLWQVLGKKLT